MFFSDQNQTQLPFLGPFLDLFFPLCVCVHSLFVAYRELSQRSQRVQLCLQSHDPEADVPRHQQQHHHPTNTIITLDLFIFFTLTHYNKLSTRKLSLTKRKYCAEQIKSLADGLGSEQSEQQDISKLYLCWARENIVWKMVFLNSRIRLFYLLDRFQSIQKDNIPKSYVEEFNKKQKNRGKVCVYRSLNVGAHRIKLTHARFNIHVYCWNALLE